MLVYNYQRETRKISGIGSKQWQTKGGRMGNDVSNLENVAPTDEDHEMTDVFEFPRTSATSRAQGGTRGGFYDSDSSELESEEDRHCIHGVHVWTR